MKSSQISRFKNRLLMYQSMEQRSPNIQHSTRQASIAVFSQRNKKGSSSPFSRSKRRINIFWNQIQQQLYAQFWLSKFIQNPCQNYSITSPLKRKSYNKEVSDYIRQKGLKFNIQCYKSPDRCKSKFGSIRRKLYRARKDKNSKQSNIEFIDFIVQKVERFKPRTFQIQEKLDRIKELRENQGPFVKIALEEYRFIKSTDFRETYQSLSNFLVKQSNLIKNRQKN